MIWLILPEPLGREKHHNFRGHQVSMTTKITAKASNVPEGDNLGNSPSAAPARQHDGQRHPRTCPSKPPTLFPIPVLPAQVRWGWRSERDQVSASSLMAQTGSFAPHACYDRRSNG